VQNYKSGKTKVAPLEIHVTKYLIAEVTYIPRT